LAASELLPRGDRAALLLQREVGRVLAPLWVPFVILFMRFGMGWRIEGREEARRRFQGLRREGARGLLICANHLTMVDSFLIAWALAPPWWYVLHYAWVPWNTPERENFARIWWMRGLVYVMKCIPVQRGGNRREVGQVLARVGWLLSRGEAALIFPEGGRSRSGRVASEASTYGVGRIVRALPGRRVLCVYLRGESQQTWSDTPVRGERFHVRVEALEPKSESGGLRGSLEVSRQVLAKLAEMEREHLDARQ
jgi:1-acyl-sn-glycerol-3-phosphate acyltransferase